MKLKKPSQNEAAQKMEEDPIDKNYRHHKQSKNAQIFPTDIWYCKTPLNKKKATKTRVIVDQKTNLQNHFHTSNQPVDTTTAITTGKNNAI